jgi:hypothetical protein
MPFTDRDGMAMSDHSDDSGADYSDADSLPQAPQVQQTQQLLPAPQPAPQLLPAPQPAPQPVPQMVPHYIIDCFPESAAAPRYISTPRPIFPTREQANAAIRRFNEQTEILEIMREVYSLPPLTEFWRHLTKEQQRRMVGFDSEIQQHIDALVLQIYRVKPTDVQTIVASAAFTKAGCDWFEWIRGLNAAQYAHFASN